MIVGDINTNDILPNTDKNGDVAVLLGLDTPETSDDMVDLLATIPHQPVFTHMIGRQFDRMIVTPNLMKDDPQRTDLVFRKAEVRKNLVVRGKQQDKDHMDIFWKIPEAERDLSDHYRSSRSLSLWGRSSFPRSTGSAFCPLSPWERVRLRVLPLVRQNTLGI